MMKTYSVVVSIGEFTKVVELTAAQIGVSEESLDDLINKENEENIPRCCSCGTTKNVFKDGWYGYRCNSEGCCVF